MPADTTTSSTDALFQSVAQVYNLTTRITSLLYTHLPNGITKLLRLIPRLDVHPIVATLIACVVTYFVIGALVGMLRGAVRTAWTVLKFGLLLYAIVWFTSLFSWEGQTGGQEGTR
ncbi:hypothetical protein HDV00_005769 [Rhizophlyctis rosea]|nr:hypothetical protein HDV00_005769 [Rhizophlyctis rosea]